MYQGMRGPNLRNLVDMLNEKVINRDPDLTIIIDIDPEISLKRAKSRKTAEERFEDFGLELQMKMRKGFIELAKEFSNRIELVNGQANDLGINIIDVRIKRADLPDANSQAIYRRMQTERQQEAAEFRAKNKYWNFFYE